MLKYLLIALLVIWLFYSPAVRGKLRGHAPRRDAKPGSPPKSEAMVQCAHCGVHLPESDAVKDADGRTYCGTAHRQAGPARA